MATPQIQEPLIYKPNVRPEGIEVAGDPEWRAWRLRKRRPEIRDRYTATFPQINHLLDREANALIDTEDNVKVAPFVTRRLEDLRNDPDYRVERLQFRPLESILDEVDAVWEATHPRKQRQQDDHDILPSFFFERLSSSLFVRVWDFAAETFGQKPAVDARSDGQRQADFDDRLQATDWTRQLLQTLPSEFVRCVSEVARGDYRNRGWKTYDPHGYEFMFLDRDQRVHLCTAVIAKLLQEQCFDSLLFGARKPERVALRKTDEAQEDTADNFARKMSRAASVPKYLTGDLFTANFWEEVDRVTMGILELLLPMINFVGKFEPNVGALPLTEVHQQLHNIVAEAGWLANGLSLSRSCFWIDFPQPGQLWDIRQEHTTDVVWTASKAFADEEDINDLVDAMREWRRARLIVYNALPDDPKPEVARWSRSTYELEHPRPRQVRRTAKVQISMWPFFERSFPYGQDLVSGNFNSGESTTVLQRAQVVYYAGDDADEGELKEDCTFKQYLEEYERKNNLFWVPRAWTTWPIIVLLLYLALYFAVPDLYARYKEAEYNQLGLLKSTTQDWSWPSWNLPGIGWPHSAKTGQPFEYSHLSVSPIPSHTTLVRVVTLEETSAPSSRHTACEVSPPSTRKQKPAVYTSDVYSTRYHTITTTQTITRPIGNTKNQNIDDRHSSATTVPTSWTNTVESTKKK